jgi:hypothetical protein
MSEPAPENVSWSPDFASRRGDDEQKAGWVIADARKLIQDADATVQRYKELADELGPKVAVILDRAGEIATRVSELVEKFLPKGPA